MCLIYFVLPEQKYLLSGTKVQILTHRRWSNSRGICQRAGVLILKSDILVPKLRFFSTRRWINDRHLPHSRCPHTTIHLVCSYCDMCVLILVCTCPDTSIYLASSYWDICVLILLYSVFRRTSSCRGTSPTIPGECVRRSTVIRCLLVTRCWHALVVVTCFTEARMRETLYRYQVCVGERVILVQRSCLLSQEQKYKYWLSRHC
jgi:hypothetical protein